MKTIFRVFKDRGDVIALFPEIPADLAGEFCESYMHTGQHGAASPMGSHMTRITRPATPEEAAPLMAELARIGYDVEPVKRVSFQMHRTRAREARGYEINTKPLPI